jgi:hypothetical protein
MYRLRLLFLGGRVSLLLKFFCLFINLIQLLCLSKACGLGGSGLVRIIVKPLLNVCRQLGKINFGNTPFVLNTMPSASTPVTVAFLYSFPFVVLKSSDCAEPKIKGRPQQATVIVFIC